MLGRPEDGFYLARAQVRIEQLNCNLVQRSVRSPQPGRRCVLRLEHGECLRKAVLELCLPSEHLTFLRCPFHRLM